MRQSDSPTITVSDDSAHAGGEGDLRGEQADHERHDRRDDALDLQPVRQRQQLADRPAAQPQLRRETRARGQVSSCQARCQVLRSV